MPLYDEDKANKKVVQKYRAATKLRSNAIDEGLKNLVKTYEGRQYIWWLLERSKAIGQNAYAGTAEATAFVCGEQNVGQQVLAHLLEVAPDAYLMMIQEAKNERSKYTPDSGQQLGLFDADTSPGADEYQ